MRITKDRAFILIGKFAIKEEYDFLQCGEFHEAYQYRWIREQLYYALLKEGIKGVRKTLAKMTTRNLDPRGVDYWIYDPYLYVENETARNLLVEFAKTF